MTTLLKYGATEYELENCIEQPDFTYPLIIQRNPLTGEKFYNQVKFYDTFLIKDWIFKYENPKSKFLEIKALEGLKVQFKPHFETDYIKSMTDSGYINFFIIEVIPYQIVNSDIDYMIIRLASEQFINQASYTVYVDENGNPYTIDDNY